MATRPSPRSRDGTRPRSTSGRPPSSPRSSDSSSQPAGNSVSASPASDKTMPSFLRPTVSSSLHSSSWSLSSSSSKGPAVTQKRPIDKLPVQPVGAPRPITPKDKAKAAAVTSRWAAVSPKQLIQRASNAIKGSKSRGKKSKEVAGPATSSSGKEGARASAETKTETTRVQSVEEHHQQPETPAESPPAVQAEEVLAEPKAEQNEQQEATSQEVVSTDVATEEERGREEQVSTEEPRGEAEKDEDVEEEKVVLEESEALKVETPEPEEKPQTGVVADTETEALKNAEDELSQLPPAAVVQEASKESATPNGQDELSTSTFEETVVEEETKAEEWQQEGTPKPEEIMENSERSVISEEQKVQPAATEKQEDVAGEPKMPVQSSDSEPTTPLKEAFKEVETVTEAQVSASEPVTPVKEASSKDKAVIETLLSASEPTTPMKGAAKEGASMAKIPEEAGLTFKGSKVKTAMEKRSDEEQPKKKEVARSNDVIEEAKSKLLEKRKSKVKALVGAFETVMDTSPGKSS